MKSKLETKTKSSQLFYNKEYLDPYDTVEMLANYRAPVAFNKNKYNKTRENEVKKERVGFVQATPG